MSAWQLDRFSLAGTRHSSLATRHFFPQNAKLPEAYSWRLLAADMEGYSNLCQLVHAAAFGHDKLSQTNAAAAEPMAGL